MAITAPHRPEHLIDDAIPVIDVGPYLRGARTREAASRIDRADFTAAGPLRYVALGPLTNLAALLGRVQEGT